MVKQGTGPVPLNDSRLPDDLKQGTFPKVHRRGLDLAMLTLEMVVPAPKSALHRDVRITSSWSKEHRSNSTQVA